PLGELILDSGTAPPSIFLLTWFNLVLVAFSRVVLSPKVSIVNVTESTLNSNDSITVGSVARSKESSNVFRKLFELVIAALLLLVLSSTSVILSLMINN